MSELLHPQIEFDVISQDSTELDIVNDLVTILKLQQRRMRYSIDNLEVETAITESVEMFSTLEDTSIAMRIIRSPVLALSGLPGANEVYPSRSYVVLAVEFGEIDAESAEAGATDSSFHWHPYITAVIDRRDLESSDDPKPPEIEILKSLSGEDLNHLELMHAGAIIEQMKKEAIALALGDELVYEQAEPFYQYHDPLNASSITAGELSDRLYEARSCQYCLDHGATVCHHPQAN